MSWIHKLYETYENNLISVGIQSQENKVPLLPVGHIFQHAHIEITLDQNSKFNGARMLSKNEGGIIIPCTEESAGRAGRDPKTHPLCDKLQYVAKDLTEYIKIVKDDYIKKQKKFHNNYFEQLREWCDSDYSHIKAKVVLKYIEKGTVTKDLIDYGVLSYEKDGKLKPKHADLLIRWVINIPNTEENFVWRDKSLFDSWIEFDAAKKRGVELCYVLGKKTRTSNIHSRYIRNSSDSAKLISSNDNDGFTFRGRFSSAGQACGVSYEVTQKAHNALRWLIARQGKVFYEGKSKEPGLTFVTWSTTNQNIPDSLDDTYDIFGFDALKSDSELIASTSQELALKINKKMLGYRSNIEDTNNVVVMGLDSATLGRLAITYYRELRNSEFLNKIENWHRTCAWIHEYKKTIDNGDGKREKVLVKFVGAPAPSDIVEAVYGCKVDDKLRKKTIERIIPCIIDEQKIPKDLVCSAVRRASNRVSMEHWEWNKTLSIACALYKKYNEKEDFDMALDENRRTRDYLYGRLLAIADSLEQWALNKAGENRQTNAARLMQRFADHPYTTWRNIELALSPYKARLGGKSKKRQNLITEVIAMFNEDEFISDKKLSGEFLLGYHCQRDAIANKNDEERTQNSTQVG